MNSTGEALHPNWCALTTLNVPLKRFVRPGAAEEATKAVGKGTIAGVSGSEVQQFYKEILETPATNTRNNRSNKTRTRAKELPSIPFDRNQFFRLAMSNAVKELSQMRIGDKEDLNVCDNYGWTALMMASCEGAEDAVSWLLHQGANTEARDKSGNTALKLARRKNHTAIVEMLESNNCAISSDLNEEQGLEKVHTPFYCSVCQREYSESTWRAHQTSTVHQFSSSHPPFNKLHKFNISAKNRGLQLMVKQGWDREHGLGPTQNGRLYPVKTVLRKQRTGLGIEQLPARVTHFQAFDLSATKRRNAESEYGTYQKRRNRNEMKREKIREWKRERRLRNELS